MFSQRRAALTAAFISPPGLVARSNFPYDVLKCPTDVGGWVLGGNLQGIGLLGDELQAISHEGAELSSKTTYFEVCGRDSNPGCPIQRPAGPIDRQWE